MGSFFGSAKKTAHSMSQQKNDNSLVCPHCNCKVFRPHAAALVENKKFVLPQVADATDRTDSDASDTVHSRWWRVSDQFDFENIGFTRDSKFTSQQQEGQVVKFLVCADCEREPIGFHLPQESPLAYYIRIDLVKELQ